MATRIEDLKDTIRRVEETLGRSAPVLHLLRAQLQALERQAQCARRPERAGSVLPSSSIPGPHGATAHER